MCAGKSTVGRLLADRLHKEFVETDALVEQKAGMSVAQVFSSFGEERFRVLEADVVADVAAMNDAVIACGGGVVLRRPNVDLLKTGAVIVYLGVSPQTVLRRLGPPSDVRPLLSGEDREERVLKLMEQRLPVYLAAAELSVDTSGLTPDSVASLIEKLLKDHERTHRDE
jgi:shikimate kinase